MKKIHTSLLYINSGRKGKKMQNVHNEIAQVKIQQYLSNVKVITELSKPKPDINILKSYEGFGGLRQCFNDKQLYGKLMHSIRGVFGEDREREVFNTLRHSCKSAYYTPPELVKFMYRYLVEVCKFKGGSILEPSCGNGVFFEHMPDDVRNNSHITGVEMDLLTSKIVQGIYPEVEVINQPIQEVNFENKKYDLIIGNPPYGYEVITDEAMPDISNYTIHHYFIAKCIRLLEDGGILAFVVPSFCLDIPRQNTRAIINNEAVLIDAVRLPDNLFNQAKVTVDVVFFRKTGKKIHNFTESVAFEYEGRREMVNEFWKANPHRILGNLTLKWVEAYKRYVPCCITDNKAKILNYLVNCKFDFNTLNNYQEILNPLWEKQDQNVFDIPEEEQNLLIEAFEAVNNVCDDIKFLELEARKSSNKMRDIIERFGLLEKYLKKNLATRK